MVLMSEANRYRALMIPSRKACFANAKVRSIRILAVGLQIEEEVMKFMKPNDDGNEPAPLMLIAVALIPLLGVLGWAFGMFG